MHRILWLLCFVFCLVPKLEAQQDYFETYYTTGPIVRIVQSNLNFSNDQINIPESEPEVGYQFGGFFRARVNDLYVQTELLYARTQNQLIFKDFNGVTGFNPQAEFEFTSLEIPILIGHFFDKLRIETGPAVSVLFSGDQFFLNERTDVTDLYNRVSLQYRIGVGLDINDVLVNFSYEVGLSKTG